jgi:hypothetical protein
MAKFKIDWFRAETVGELGELHRYYKLVEAQLDEASRLELYAIKAQPAPQDRDAYQEAIDAHRYKFEETLPRMLMYSLVSSLYTVVEYRLDGIVKKKTDITRPEKKSNGNVAKRTDCFLKNANLASLTENELLCLEDFILVRNCVVHDTGFVEGSRKEDELRHLIKANPDKLDLDWEKRIIVSKTYFTENRGAFLAMFQRLFTALDFGPNTMTRVEEPEDP